MMCRWGRWAESLLLAMVVVGAGEVGGYTISSYFPGMHKSQAQRYSTQAGISLAKLSGRCMLDRERGSILFGQFSRAGAVEGVLGMVGQTEIPSFECVKNVRDLASVGNSPVKPGRVIRAACVGTASAADECLLVDTVKTLVDLRSEQEYNGDMIKYNSTIFEEYDTMFYNVEKTKSGRIKTLIPTRPLEGGSGERARTRHLLSVIDEGIYKRGVFKKLSLKKKVKAAAYIGISMIRARKVFLDYINAAGLPLLNELILDYGGASIKAVLDVLSNRSNHPVAFYCTAGKDRTGLVAMLVLSSLGVDKESIINDYVISDSVYADMNDKSAMVGALQQQQLDPERFLRAPRSVMESTMELLNREYGGATGYMDRIGFGPQDRQRLRSALCDD